MLPRTVEGLKQRGMHNRSLMIVVKGLVKASSQMKGKYFKQVTTASIRILSNSSVNSRLAWLMVVMHSTEEAA
jgi:NifB/MoaA-like Fe-S oxidoreductase